MKSRALFVFISTSAIGATLSLTPITAAQIQTAERLEVTPAGAITIKEFRQADGRILGQINEGGGFVDPQIVTNPRWTEADNGLSWIGRSVALGDSGAAIMAGKGLNSQSATLYSTTDAQPIFNYDTFGSEDPVVAVAARAPVSAAFIVYDRDPGGGYDFEGSIQVFNNTGTGNPEWSYTFPRTLNYFGGGVAVSDDGKVILAWKANPLTETLLVEAFEMDGTPISSGEISIERNGDIYFHSRQSRLSDDGTRAYFFVGVEAVIYDVTTGTVEYEHYIGGSFDSHALSGDGKRFAYGYVGSFRVYEEISSGNWSKIAGTSFPRENYAAHIDLNTDGSRLGYLIQRYLPAYDHIEIGMYDVDNNRDIFNHAYEAPGTTTQLVAADIEIDELGQYVAGASWGDSNNATPETFVYDAAGNVTCEIDARGSAFAVAIDADGDVAASGHKAVHANEFGSGGDIIVTDTDTQGLQILGYPEAGQSINLQLNQPATNIYVAVALKLNLAGTPLEIALNTRVAMLGPYNVPNGGLTVPLNLPDIPFVQGNQFHFQAGKKNGDLITNKVSIRVQP